MKSSLFSSHSLNLRLPSRTGRIGFISIRRAAVPWRAARKDRSRRIEGRRAGREGLLAAGQRRAVLLLLGRVGSRPVPGGDPRRGGDGGAGSRARWHRFQRAWHESDAGVARWARRSWDWLHSMTHPDETMLVRLRSTRRDRPPPPGLTKPRRRRQSLAGLPRPEMAQARSPPER